ncbi:hypothetical protein NMG60_11006701 [Bertholletia excelsa]
MALAENYRGLTSLRLQNCFLVTGEGLKTVGAAIGNELEELALTNIDVNMRKLPKLDLSYNKMLIDIELTSMLVSCSNLIELKLRGCRRLTNLAMVSMSKSCRNLEYVDVTQCRGIQGEAVEKFIMNSRRLRQMQVEECKLSDVARRWVSNKFIEMVFD